METEARGDRELVCRGIAITPAALCELDDERPVVQIAWAEIENLTLCYGISAERPIAALILGLLLIGFGAAFARHLLLWLIYGGKAYDIEAFAVGLIPMGAWLIHTATRRRYFLRVRTNSGQRKLAFGSRATPAEVMSFAAAVGRSGNRPVGIELGPEHSSLHP